MSSTDQGGGEAALRHGQSFQQPPQPKQQLYSDRGHPRFKTHRTEPIHFHRHLSVPSSASCEGGGGKRRLLGVASQCPRNDRRRVEIFLRSSATIASPQRASPRRQLWPPYSAPATLAGWGRFFRHDSSLHYFPLRPRTSLPVPGVGATIDNWTVLPAH